MGVVSLGLESRELSRHKCQGRAVAVQCVCSFGTWHTLKPTVLRGRALITQECAQCVVNSATPAGLKDWEKRLIISDRAHLGKIPMGPWGWFLLAPSVVQSSRDPGGPT